MECLVVRSLPRFLEFESAQNADSTVGMTEKDKLGKSGTIAVLVGNFVREFREVH